jgi:hypothetical protein
MFTYICIYIYIFIVSQNKIVLVRLSEGATNGGQEKENFRE